MKTVITPSYQHGGIASCLRCNILVVSSKDKSPQLPSKGSEPPPPRITSNLKRNLQFLRLWKKFQKGKSSTPKPATSYRRKKMEKEALPEDEQLYRDPTTTLFYTNQDLDDAVPVLLVDGYNVCGYWAKLKKHFMKGKLGVARQKLLDELVTFSVVKEVKVVLVFDAMMSGLPTHKENFAGVDVIFSGETCADAWIEKEGAYIWSSKALISEIKAANKEVERMYQKQGRLLKHNLDSQVVDALKSLRKKLSEDEPK